MKASYADKVRGKVATVSNTRRRRVCDGCKSTLLGKRGHGFPSPNGRMIECTPGCGKPTR